MGKLSYAREAGVELAFESKHTLPEPKNVETTHELITILGNLIDNAIDAVGKRSEKRVKVKLDFELRKGKLYLEVADSGKGIQEETLASIFTKGFSTKGQNRGYGLYLVKQSIDKLEGNLMVDSFHEKGTVFYVEIPYEIRGADDD
ncbi:ATP-binding protein [Ammoniphilus sp. 3BR4]